MKYVWSKQTRVCCLQTRGKLTVLMVMAKHVGTVDQIPAGLVISFEIALSDLRYKLSATELLQGNCYSQPTKSLWE